MGARLLLPYPSPHSGVTSTSLTAIEIVALSRAALLMGARVFLPYPSPNSGVSSTLNIHRQMLQIMKARERKRGRQFLHSY